MANLPLVITIGWMAVAQVANEAAATKVEQAAAAFNRIDRLLETMAKWNTVKLYEGLPHQEDEKELLQKELQAKVTVSFHGFPFYAEVLDTGGEDIVKLADLMTNSKTYEKWGGGKFCGGFHPDYLLEFQVGKDAYRVQVCLGCQEVKIFGPEVEIYCDIAEPSYKTLHRMLKKQRKQRPPSRFEFPDP